MPAQYIIWSKFHSQTTKKKPTPPQKNPPTNQTTLKKIKKHIQTYTYTQWGKRENPNEADALAAFLARSLGTWINTTSFLSY